MKKLTLFKSLNWQVKKWRQHQKKLARKKQKGANASHHFRHRFLLTQLSGMQTRSAVVFLIAVVSLTGVLGHRFYNQPQLKIDTIAPQTLKAPATAQIEDTKTTQAKREAARKVTTPVLTIDLAVNQQIVQKLQTDLDRGSELREIAGAFPFAATSILSTSTQANLRSCPDAQWQAVLAALDDRKSANTENEAQPKKLQSLKNEAIATAVVQLKAYRLKANPQQFSALITTISQARQRYAKALNKLSQLQAAKPPTLYESSLLELSNDDWWKTKTGIRTSAERILTQGISSGLQPKVLQEAVNLQVRSLVPAATESLATEMLLSVLKPNLKQDEEQMRQQAEQAAAAVKPVLIEKRKGDFIIKKGERISYSDFVLLDHFNLSRREINWLNLAKLGGIVSLAVGVFGLVGWRSNKLRQRDSILVLLLALSTPLLVRLGLPYLNLPAVGLLLGSFYGFPVGGTLVGLLTLLLPVSLEIGWKHLLTGAVGGMLSSWMAGRMRSREELSLLGVSVGLTQALVYLLGNTIFITTPGFSWYVVLREAALFGLSGLAWSIVALGLSPYLEHLFDLVTPIRLAELASPNRPLLKRLATQAPGTFQHTLFVATLAEAAAKVLGCNVELVRTGTLYHDIGKLHDPSAFIENQIGGVNKHDQINNPWQSADIIKKHVSEGLVMARKYRLPRAIQAFIPEHQGTILIAYFYYQAQQLAQQEASILVSESDFRYDGPIPQSRETGIVMLADACEAALRTLQASAQPLPKEPTREEALAMVNKILRSRWQDNQLVDSGLTRNELTQIAETFVEVWQQFHHKRIAYPKVRGEGRGKG